MTAATLLTTWAVLTTVSWGVITWIVGRGQRSILRLADVPPVPVRRPKVSVVIPVRNEARNLERALRSVLALAYEALEVCAVDDRSTDGTAQILARLSGESPRLKVLTVKDVPPGWLGKNHASWLGAQRTCGEWLLFTDADVVMDPTTLARAVSYLERHSLDHLAVSPEVLAPGRWLAACIGCFTLNFALYAFPWKAKDPRSSRFIGIGAFNLIRRAVYEAVGTHAELAACPIDDMMLGKKVKQRGYRQEMLFGRGCLEIEWYATLRDLVCGLEKNAFAGAFNRVSVVVAGTLGALVLDIGPFLGVGLIPHLSGWLCLATVGMIVWLVGDNARIHHHPRWSGGVFPLAALLLVYAVWRSTILALWRGGITWRGTFYPMPQDGGRGSRR